MSFNTTTDRLLDKVADKLETQQTSLTALESTGTLTKNAGTNTETQVTSHNSRAFGQAGAILVTGTTAVTCGVSGKVFVAIQFLEDTIFDSGSGGLVAETEQLFPDDTGTGTSIDADGGAAIDSITFPKGMTLYGRYDGFKLTSTGKVIAYVG